jgi:pantoate--beta-alanine ligase
MLQVITTVEDLRKAVRAKGEVVLVPTMGNLHEGHLSLVRLARERGDLVVTSIFVNRLQFGPQEDFAAYPRTLERDCELLVGAGCDIVFAPSEEEMYPHGEAFNVQPPAALGDILEGHFRPGFFTGVCTVVLKLFNIVQPSAAVFGRKDYQQLLLVRNMVRRLSLPVEIMHGATVRDASGLALSSRNGYLNKVQRVEASQLHAVLSRISVAARHGRRNWPEIERSAKSQLCARGWQPDYVTVRRQCDLGEPAAGDRRLIVLGAARLGTTRLIDNVEV